VLPNDTSWHFVHLLMSILQHTSESKMKSTIQVVKVHKHFKSDYEFNYQFAFGIVLHYQ